jgi:hypothetical protein
MGLFDFLKKKKAANKKTPMPPGIIEDRSSWTGKDFEFLITGDINIPADNYDQIMTPNTFVWSKANRNNSTYYQVGADEFSYSWEEPRIQMTFNKDIPFEKAKQVAEEVIGNIKAAGQEAELIVLNSSQVYRFE